MCEGSLDILDGGIYYNKMYEYVVIVAVLYTGVVRECGYVRARMTSSEQNS